jgi:4-diphosphocytidyl-2C-methyl-D-erythritol kinase
VDFTLGKNRDERIEYVHSVIQAIGIADHITLTKSDKPEDYVGHDHHIINLALNEMRAFTNMELPCGISVDLKMPVSSGMKRASSKAGAVLRLVKVAFDLKLSAEDLEKIAGKVSETTPFFIRGGRSAINLKPEFTISQIEVPYLHYIIMVPNISFAKQQFFNLYKRSGQNHESFIVDEYPRIGTFLSIMRKDAEEAGISGIGPAVFAGYKNSQDALGKMQTSMKMWPHDQIFVASTMKPFEL